MRLREGILIAIIFLLLGLFLGYTLEHGRKLNLVLKDMRLSNPRVTTQVVAYSVVAYSYDAEGNTLGVLRCKRLGLE